MTKVLVTGFDPFGGDAMNPAFEAVKLMPDMINDATIIKLEVPTVFKKSIDVLKEAIAKEKPEVVVCVGQAGGRFDVTPERVAINQDDARIPDNEKNQPIDVPIFEDGDTAYFSKLPIKAMVATMREGGVPASVSNSAGTFVCNHIMYGLLYLIDKEFPDIRGGFIHVPFATEQVIDRPNAPSLTLEQIAEGLRLSVVAILENEEDHKVVGGAIS
jgi:pyroglutamyl-peptidase